MKKSLAKIKWSRGVIPVEKIAHVVGDYADKLPRSEICDCLREYYKSNGGMFFSSELSWFRLIDRRIKWKRWQTK